MYDVIGWLNVLIFIVLFLPYVLRLVNDKLLSKKSEALKSVIKVLRKPHKLFGMLLLIGAFVHGYMALGEFKLHTGSLISMMVVATVIFGMLFNMLKKKWAFKFHKIFATLIVVFLLLHLIYPSALYYLFGI